MAKPEITIAIQCHNFQKRLIWMLSSLADQNNREKIIVDIAHMPDNGNPTTEKVIELFKDRITIKPTIWVDLNEFQYRGLTRNRQISTCKTDWIMFSDCDMIYHPTYFRKLLNYLKERPMYGKYLFSTGRMSNPVRWTERLLERHNHKYRIRRPWRKACNLPLKKMKNVGAGFCQIINVNLCPHHGYYVKVKSCADRSWSHYSEPRSDIQFRKRITKKTGLKKLPVWFTKNAIHLNHIRDPDVKRHLEVQR